MQVFLDVSHLSDEKKENLRSILEIYQKFTGEDPGKVPMKIFPAMHYTMGGAWVDWPAADDPDRFERYRQMTNLPGCFSIGEADYQFHGANRLGANALLACIFSGLVVGEEVPRYVENLHSAYEETPEIFFKDALAKEEEIKSLLLSSDGPENIHSLHDELSDLMIRYVTVKRDNGDLIRTLDKIKELKERYRRISLADRGRFVNQTYVFANQFGAMLELALVITKGALLRNESRGSHFKPEFPARDDENWMKTTVATYDSASGEPLIDYEPVKPIHLAPSGRDYTRAKREKHTLANVPTNIVLPV